MAKKYRITATRIEYFEIEVEADSKEEAMEFAEENKHLFKFCREEDLEILTNSCNEIRRSNG
jgi:hypothetical protein